MKVIHPDIFYSELRVKLKEQKEQEKLKVKIGLIILIPYILICLFFVFSSYLDK